MRILVALSITLAAVLCSCVAQHPKEEAKARVPAAADNLTCDQVKALDAQTKLNYLFEKHLDSLAKVLPQAPDVAKLLNGGEATQQYTKDFIGSEWNRAKHDAEALAATTKFLAPGPLPDLGYKTLVPTLTRECDFFEKPQVKMVHALGTMASAQMKLYEDVQIVGPDGQTVASETTKNPWTGLFDPHANGGGIPLLIRFSIANPIIGNLQIGDQDLSTEFIPGLGLKFLIDGQKSVDLIAMESLAGQGKDQNYFKYEFSPDFSGHAPPSFVTSTGTEKATIIARYNHNRVNRLIMDQVGKRFSEVLVYQYQLDPKSIDWHSPVGPNPVMISIQRMAATNRFGHKVAEQAQKRPWRLVFRPALPNLDPDRRATVTSPVPYSEQKLETDFRYKLAALSKGDTIYFVEAETQSKKRYRIGEIVLDSAPFPSPFADEEFFIQHDLELNRRPGHDGAIAEP